MLGLPLWGVFPLTLLLILLTIEGGYRWAKSKSVQKNKEKEAPVGAMVAATLGLLSFLLAFSFGLSVDHFNARRVALLNEANAIRTTYLVAGAIEEPHRTEVRRILRSYVHERLEWTGVEKPGGAPPGKVLLQQLWSHAEAVGAQNPGGVDVFLSSVSRVNELYFERTMAREGNRIPPLFWVVLAMVAVLAMAAMGYHGGVAGTARSPVMLAVAITFAAVIILIADIERPGEGWVNVSQQPMIDVRDWITAAGR